MADALEALIYGVRRIYASLTALPTRASLTFDATAFDVADDAVNLTTVVALKAVSPAAHQKVTHKTIGTSYAVDPVADFHMTMSGTAITATLPLTPLAGDRYEFKSNGVGNTIDGHGKNIDGAATYVMIQNEAATVHYNGVQWELV